MVEKIETLHKHEKIWDRRGCGSGKTKSIVDIIKEFIARKKIMIVMPTHANIREFIKRTNLLHQTDIVENRKINYVRWHHIKGKSQPNMCETNMSRNPLRLCDKCEANYQDCKYLKQFKDMEKLDVIFVTPYQLYVKEKYNPEVVIIDESIQHIILPIVTIPERFERYFRFKDVDCDDCSLKEDCPHVKYKLRFERRCVFKAYGVKDVDVDEFDVNTYEERMFKQKIERLEKNWMYGAYDEWNDCKVVTGEIPMDFSDVEYLCFNCASSKHSMVRKIFGDDIHIIRDERKLENEIVMLDEKMTINKTKKHIKDIPFLCELFNIPMNQSTLLFTKKKIESMLGEEDIGGMNTSHYGMSRGFNEFEHCSSLMIYGRLALSYPVQNLLKMTHHSDEEVKWIGAEEEYQAMHRIRPLLNPDNRLFLFSNSLKEELDDSVDILCKWHHIDKCRFILRHREDLGGLNKRELYKKVKGHREDVKLALEILRDYGHIEGKIFEWGGQLSYVEEEQNCGELL